MIRLDGLVVAYDSWLMINVVKKCLMAYGEWWLNDSEMTVEWLWTSDGLWWFTDGQRMVEWRWINGLVMVDSWLNNCIRMADEEAWTRN